MTAELYIGLMSGTSMDGIDAALVRINQQTTELLASHLHPWPVDLRENLLQITTQPQCTLNDFGTLDSRCGEQFALAVKHLLDKVDIPADAIIAIGSHGQTLQHGPDEPAPYSIQIGDPNRIAEITGITTVADFRRRDIAAGGQGAPLLPIFHKQMLASASHDRIVLNIGGIANITLLSANNETVGGFDTGPGNCLLDRWINQNKNQSYDANGDWADSGKIIPGLLQQLGTDSYFSQPSPKSTGTEYFSEQWLSDHLVAMSALDPADVQATLLALTVKSITDAIKKTSPDAGEVLVCGGGVHNQTMMSSLQAAMGNTPVRSTADYNLDPDWVEAMAFAWLAQQTLNRKPGNLPSVTGAKHPVILGGIYYG